MGCIPMFWGFRGDSEVTDQPSLPTFGSRRGDFQYVAHNIPRTVRYTVLLHHKKIRVHSTLRVTGERGRIAFCGELMWTTGERGRIALRGELMWTTGERGRIAFCGETQVATGESWSDRFLW